MTSAAQPSKPKTSGASEPDARTIDTDIVRALAEVLGSFDLTEIEVEQGDLRIRVTRQPPPPAVQTVTLPAAQMAMATPHPLADIVRPAAENPGSVKSPMVGTAYLRPSPEARPFVEVGSQVKAGDRIMLVEAMKTFNDIVAPRAGTVTAIFIEDGQPVEYGEPLLVIE